MPSIHPTHEVQPAARAPSLATSLILVFALLVQQGAFVSVPLVMSAPMAGLRDADNPLNTAAVLLSLVLMAAVSLPSLRQVGSIANSNKLALGFTLLVLASALWSIHPDVSLRRGVGYLLTILLAVYLPARFRLDSIMRLLSLSFVVSALASVLFVAVLPRYGIMQEQALAGNWRGVFAHKNQLGAVMAVGIFCELYLLASGATRRARSLGLVAFFMALIVLSESRTALVMALGYLAGAGIFLLWRRQQMLGQVILLNVVLAVLCIAIVLAAAPDFAFGLIGKDATLTGRLDIWNIAANLIDKRPLLGWGYRAVWLPGDWATARADEMLGWSVPNAHNAFLEIALQLGFVGLAVLLLMIGTAFWRGLRCWTRGINPLGWYSLVFFLLAVVAGMLEPLLGQNQVIQWVVFNVLLFSCGTQLVQLNKRQPEPVDAPASLEAPRLRAS